MFGMSQCVFDFGRPPDYALQDFFPGGNALALTLVQRLGTEQGEAQLYLWGEAGSGKTHLLQGACAHLGAQGLPAAYVNLAEAPYPGVLDGLERVALVALDNVQATGGSAPWELALFDLINRLREKQVPLLLAADAPPVGLAVALPDLRSRLVWGAVLQLQPLNDADKREVLRAEAQKRGMELADEVLDFMFAHLARDFPSLLAGLARLDRASMEKQRRVTLPLAREVFAS